MWRKGVAQDKVERFFNLGKGSVFPVFNYIFTNHSLNVFVCVNNCIYINAFSKGFYHIMHFISMGWKTTP